MNFNRQFAIRTSQHMPIVFRLLILSVATVAAGCASTFQLSPTATEMKRNMTPKQAEGIIKEQVYLLNDSGRIFSTDTERPVCGNANVAVNGSEMAYNANYREDVKSGVEGSVQSGTARYVEKYVIKTGRFKMDLKDIPKIRIWKTADSTFKVPCPNTMPGYYVILHKTKTSGVSVIFNVSEETLDRLLAALSYYSPNVEIKMGLGL